MRISAPLYWTIPDVQNVLSARVDAKELVRMVRLNSVPESYVPTDEIREARVLVRGRQALVENRTKYANKIHGLLSDHGITENVKPLSVGG